MALWLSRRCLWSQRIDVPLQNFISFQIRLLDPLRHHRETKAKHSLKKKKRETSERKEAMALFCKRKCGHLDFLFPQCDCSIIAQSYLCISCWMEIQRNHDANLHHSSVKPGWHNKDNKKVAQLNFKHPKWASFWHNPQISKPMTITCHFQRHVQGFPQSTEAERPFWWDRLNLLLLNVTAMIIWRMGGDG